MDRFKSLIKCGYCKTENKTRNFNRKNNNATIEYICSLKKNTGQCNSPIIKEKMLLEVISKHCQLHNKDFTLEKLKLFVLRVDVERDGTYIRYRDSSVSKISDNELIF